MRWACCWAAASPLGCAGRRFANVRCGFGSRSGAHSRPDPARDGHRESRGRLWKRRHPHILDPGVGATMHAVRDSLPGAAVGSCDLLDGVAGSVLTADSNHLVPLQQFPHALHTSSIRFCRALYPGIITVSTNSDVSRPNPPMFSAYLPHVSGCSSRLIGSVGIKRRGEGEQTRQYYIYRETEIAQEIAAHLGASEPLGDITAPGLASSAPSDASDGRRASDPTGQRNGMV